jgi:uncharacterized protein (DUF1330 family)
MAAYFIAQYVVNDPALYGEYAQSAMPSIAKHGGELLVFDAASQTIEGEPPGPQTVILKFESEDKLRAWYDSPEYQEIVGKRLEATNGHAVIAQFG